MDSRDLQVAGFHPFEAREILAGGVYDAKGGSVEIVTTRAAGAGTAPVAKARLIVYRPSSQGGGFVILPKGGMNGERCILAADGFAVKACNAVGGDYKERSAAKPAGELIGSGTVDADRYLEFVWFRGAGADGVGRWWPIL